MKKSLLVNVFLTLIVSFVVFGSSLYAQEERNLKTELLVYILPGSLELPEEAKGFITLAQANSSIKSESLQTALTNSKVKSLGRAFPAWPNRDSVVVRSNGESVELPPLHRIFILNFDDEKERDMAIDNLCKLPDVVFAEKHIDLKFHNDPMYIDGSQWYLNNDGSNGGILGADINIEEAWSIFTGSPNTIIAILDEGVDFSHDEFLGRISGDSYQCGAHGTLVSGVAAANAMNGEGIRGVDRHAQILSKKVTVCLLNNEWPAATDIVVQKILDAVSEGADVLNCSWGEPDHSTLLRMAFDHAYNMDRVIVSSMGNDGTTLKNYPAGWRNVIAVGATQNNDVRSPFSTMGNHIDVVAPGGAGSGQADNLNILTTSINNNYVHTSGTSYSAPLVSGLASLLKEFNSNLTNDDIRQIIRLTADDNIIPGHDPEYGYGRINAGRAMQMVRDNDFLHGESYGGASVKTNLRLWHYEGYYWNLNSGVYVNVDRYEVTKRVNFDVPFCSPPVVWLRERTSKCLSGATNPNDGYPYTEITNVTETGFDVKYFVYYVPSNLSGVVINRWIPANVSNSKVAYTAVGELNIAGTAGPISGPTTVCSSWETYTLNNLPEGSTVNWDVSGNLTMSTSCTPAPGTACVKVRAASSTTNGNGEVRATVSGPCGDAEVDPYDVWVGTHHPPQIQSPYYSSGMNSVCKGMSHTMEVGSMPGVTEYQWRLIYPNGYSLTLPSTSRTASFCTDETGWYTVAVKQMKEGCSWSAESTKTFPVENCGTGASCSDGPIGPVVPRLIISPNPTTARITISEVEPANDNIPWVLRLMSQRGAVMVNVTTTLPKTISVSGLQPGVYVLHARRGQHSEQQVVVVE